MQIRLHTSQISVEVEMLFMNVCQGIQKQREPMNRGKKKVFVQFSSN